MVFAAPFLILAVAFAAAIPAAALSLPVVRYLEGTAYCTPNKALRLKPANSAPLPVSVPISSPGDRVLADRWLAGGSVVADVSSASVRITFSAETSGVASLEASCRSPVSEVACHVRVHFGVGATIAVPIVVAGNTVSLDEDASLVVSTLAGPVTPVLLTVSSLLPLLRGEFVSANVPSVRGDCELRPYSLRTTPLGVSLAAMSALLVALPDSSSPPASELVIDGTLVNFSPHYRPAARGNSTPLTYPSSSTLRRVRLHDDTPPLGRVNLTAALATLVALSVLFMVFLLLLFHSRDSFVSTNRDIWVSSVGSFKVFGVPPPPKSCGSDEDGLSGSGSTDGECEESQETTDRGQDGGAAGSDTG